MKFIQISFKWQSSNVEKNEDYWRLQDVKAIEICESMEDEPGLVANSLQALQHSFEDGFVSKGFFNKSMKVGDAISAFAAKTESQKFNIKDLIPILEAASHIQPDIEGAMAKMSMMPDEEDHHEDDHWDMPEMEGDWDRPEKEEDWDRPEMEGDRPKLEEDMTKLEGDMEKLPEEEEYKPEIGEYYVKPPGTDHNGTIDYDGDMMFVPKEDQDTENEIAYKADAQYKEELE